MCLPRSTDQDHVGDTVTLSGWSTAEGFLLYFSKLQKTRFLIKSENELGEGLTNIAVP